MITKSMQSAINDQINAELWSAYLYLSMSLDAEAKALRGISNWFFIQWLEEQDHARIFQNYMSDQGARVELRPIDGVPDHWKDPVEMYEDTLSHEKDVTGMIEKLVRLAFQEADFATLSRLQWFIDEQVEEERSAADLLDSFRSAMEDFHAIRELDKELEERKYHQAEPLKK